ncbi:MAG: hypothetical protein NC084_08740 [Bacteroides sp.]|nr:hypothetical protein [Bacteroides sp.]
MKKIIKKVTAIAMAGVMATSMVVSASAVHTNPTNGRECDSTYVYLTHHSQVGVSTAAHGKTCTVTYYSFRHLRSCSCGYSYGEGMAYQCTEIHSTCGSYKRDCGVGF